MRGHARLSSSTQLSAINRLRVLSYHDKGGTEALCVLVAGRAVPPERSEGRPGHRVDLNALLLT